MSGAGASATPRWRSVPRLAVVLGLLVQVGALGRFILAAPGQWAAGLRAGQLDRLVGTVALVLLLELLYSALWGRAWALAAAGPLQFLLALGYLPFLRRGLAGGAYAEWLLNATVVLAGLVAGALGVVAVREARGAVPPTGIRTVDGGLTPPAAALGAALCLWAGLVVAGGTIAGRAGGGAAVAGLPDATVRLALTSYRFAPATLELEAGRTTAIALVNTDAATHSFDLDALGVHVTVSGRQTAVALVAPAVPGTLAFRCREPGHTEAGMVGTITVR